MMEKTENQNRYILPVYRVTARVLGKKSITHQEVISAIKSGMPFKSIQALANEYHAASKEICYMLDINPIKLTQRKNLNLPLSLSESDRVIRFARLKEQVLIMTLGDNDVAITWLRRAQEYLDNESPMLHAITECGAENVGNLIGQITHGIF